MTASHSAPSVFVLDDDDFSHELMAGMLNKLGVTKIYTATSSKDALQQISLMASAPDFLICDILMPDMDGMDFLVELSKLHYKGKVMLLSGIDKDILGIAENVVKGDGINLIGAFAKPIKFDELRQALA